jgi:ribosomal protein S17E
VENMPIDASNDLSWQSECHLPFDLRQEQVQRYPSEYIQKFHQVFAELFETNQFEHLHLKNYESLENMIPVIYHARIQAKMEKGSRSIGKEIIKVQNKNWDKNEIFHRFLVIYEEFVHDFILPQFQEYGGILYQAVPTLRVVFPGSVAPVKPHKDADYWHDSNELNYWVPLVPVAGSNSLWSESEPGKGYSEILFFQF